MENENKDIRLLLAEAKKDTRWYEKLQKANSVEDYIKTCAEKGICFSEKERVMMAAAFIGKNQGKLYDEELEQVAGGYIPFLDECRESWNYSICLLGRVFSQKCWHLKKTKVTTEDGRVFAYYTCNKGYFSTVKQEIYMETIG